MNLLKLLGLDESFFVWKDAAACKGMDVENFFDIYEKDPITAAAMDERCITCPVMVECGTFAQKHNQEGLWGAIYWNNGRPDEKRNEHKSKETWEKIYKEYKKSA